MTPKDQIIELLAQGIPTSQIAAAVGCTDAYVSQLKADPEVQTELAKLRVAGSAEDARFDATLERAETLALNKIETNLPFANMGQALAAFKILNSARRRKDGFQQVDSGATTINVNLTIPSIAIPRYTVNAQSEIIDVAGQTMLTMAPKSLDQILAARAAANLPQIPIVTGLERAATMLETLAVPNQPRPRMAPRRIPTALSADVL